MRRGETNGKVARMHCNGLLQAARPHTRVGRPTGLMGTIGGGLEGQLEKSDQY